MYIPCNNEKVQKQYFYAYRSKQFTDDINYNHYLDSPNKIVAERERKTNKENLTKLRLQFITHILSLYQRFQTESGEACNFAINFVVGYDQESIHFGN